MRRIAPILPILAILSCGSPVGPGPLYPGYFLSKVDDQYLPVPYGEDGSLLLAASLSFSPDPRPREPEAPGGTVHLSLFIRRPDQTTQQSLQDLVYTIQNGEVHINLCPPLALCITTTELIGPVLDRYEELVLTHYLAGQPGTVYHYFPALPD